MKLRELRREIKNVEGKYMYNIMERRSYRNFQEMLKRIK